MPVLIQALRAGWAAGCVTPKSPVGARTREGNSNQLGTQSRLGEVTGPVRGRAVVVGCHLAEPPRMLPSAQLRGSGEEAVMVAGAAREVAFLPAIGWGTA